MESNLSTIFFCALGLVIPFLLARQYKNDGIDRWRWLLFSKCIRQNNHKIPIYIDKYIFKHKFSYPPLFLKILSFIPDGKRESYSHYISPTVSLIEGILIFTFILKLSDSLPAALACLTLYATTPANIIENFYLNIRCFGQLMYTICILFLYFYIVDNNFFIISLILSSILITSHRMTFQLFILTLITISILYKNLDPIILGLLSIILCIFFTRAKCLIVFKSHYSQLKYYKKLFHKNKKILKIKYKPLILALVGRNPYLLLALYIYAVNFGNFSMIEEYCMVISIIIIILAVLSTLLKGLLFIGEGYRYIGFSTPFIAIFLGLNYNFISDILFIFFILSSLCAIAYKHYFYVTNKNSADNNMKYNYDLIKIFDDLLLFKNNNNIRFMSFPPIYDDYISYHYKNVKVAFHDNGLACIDMKDFTPHSLVNPNLVSLVKKLNIDILVTHEKVMLPSTEFYEQNINNCIYIYSAIK